MATPSQAKTLPMSVWPSQLIPAPPTAFAITQIIAFFEDLGWTKTVKALRKECESHGVALDTPEVLALKGPFKKSLGELYADALLQEDDSDDSSEDSSDNEEEQENAANLESDSESNSDDSESEDKESASEDSSSSDNGSESDSDDSEADVPTKIQPAVLKRKRSDSSSESSSSEESDSDSDDSEAPPAKKTKTVTTKATSPSVSSDSESEATSVSTSEVSDDSESSDESDSSDDDEDKTETPTRRTANAGKASDDESQDSAASSATLVASPVKEVDHGDMHPSRARRMSPPAPKAFDKKNNVPFSRISKDIRVDPKFASNAYVSYDYADRAHQDLIVTKGKGFTKEKNKKKRGSYRGGHIDTTPKGIQFDD